MIRRPPRSTLFPYTNALPICVITVVPLPNSELISNSSMSRRTPGGPSPRLPDVENPSCMASARSEEHTSELQSLAYLVCRLLLEKKKINNHVYENTRNRCMPN